MNNILQNYREQIDKTDNDLLLLLEKRFSIVRKIGMYKTKNKLPIINKNLEEKKLETLVALGKEYNIPKTFIVNIWQTIFSENYKLENKL